MAKGSILVARGCSSCGDSGYRGRLAITELMTMGKEARAAVLARAPEIELERIARQSGMNTLYESGLIRVWSGLTTLDDVFSTTRGAT
ncbi:ATPase, T2SS/T4P/T4SS family [Agrobacterium salinitolerans]